MLRLPKTRNRGRSRGQSVVEFALVVPILLLLMLVAIDFGRIYLGWVNLQQMARIAANDAADHASAWQLPDTPAKQAERDKYQARITRDAEQINCELPTRFPIRSSRSGRRWGPTSQSASTARSRSSRRCPGIVGGTVLLSAETTFPIKEGVVAAVPGGGAPVSPPTEAKFIGTPLSGWAPLDVTFTDQSTNGPTSWLWTFNDAGGTGGGSVDDETSLSQGPHTVTYDCPGVPGDVCTFSVSLRAGNGGGNDTETKVGYVTVTVPPAPPAPIAEFTGSPLSGIEPVTTNFQFVELRSPPLTYTNFQWDFTSDGTWDAPVRLSRRRHTRTQHPARMTSPSGSRTAPERRAHYGRTGTSTSHTRSAWSRTSSGTGPTRPPGSRTIGTPRLHDRT